MKKVLSLVLAFAMILGSFGFVFASNFPDVKDTEYYGEPVNVLSGLGVIAGFPDGTFGTGKNVTRAQMATFITAALGIPVKGSGSTGFSDVPASHWASGYIAYAVSVGFVAGYPDKTFKPENPVSYNEALTMIVASLGYTAEALPGAWPGAFINKAQGLGILDICATTGNAPAPREDIACFLYKALTQTIGYVDKDGAFQPNIGKDGGRDTMIKRLGAEEYNDGKPFVVTGKESSDIDLGAYLGAFITAYADKDGDIIAVGEVKSEYIEGKYKNDKIGDVKVASATELKKDTKSPTTYTGEFVGFTNGDLDESITTFKIADKNLKVAVNTGSKVTTVYSVQVWDPAGTFRAGEDVQEELEDNQKLNGTYSFALNDDDEIDTDTFILEGADSLDDIKEDDIVTVYEHKSGDNKDKVAKVQVSNKTVEGTITRVNKKGDEYTIGGTAYAVSAAAVADATKAVGLAADAEGTFFLDYAGEIYDFDETKDTTKNFAILLDKGADSGRYGSSTPYAKLFLADGTTAEYEVDSDFAKDAKYTGAAKGSVVEYEIDSDNILVGLEVLTAVNKTSKTEFVGMVCEGAKAVSSTVVFSYKASTDADPETLAKNYSVLAVEDLKDAEVDAIVGGTDKGNFTAIKVQGVKAEDDKYAVFVSEDGSNKDGKIWTVLYDGAVKEMTMDKTKSASTYVTGSAAKLYTLTFSGEKISQITTAAAADYDSELITAPGKIKDVTSEGFKTAANENKVLSANAVVYIYDESDDEWTAGKLAATKYTFIELIDTNDDGKADIVLATKE